MKIFKKYKRRSDYGKKKGKYKKMSDEGRENIRKAHLGCVITTKQRLKISKKLTGLKRSDTFKTKMSKIQKGENNSNWKGGVTPLYKQIRKSKEYKLWRKAVFEKDNYTCIWCGVRGGCGRKVILNADHIKPFALFPELRFAIDNGRTLCIDCHKKTDTYGVNIKK